MYLIYNKNGKNKILRAEIIEREMPNLGEPVGPFLTNVQLQFGPIRTQFQFASTHGLMESWFVFKEMPIFYRTQQTITSSGKITEKIVEGEQGKHRMQKFNAGYFGVERFAAKLTKSGQIYIMMEKHGLTYGIPLYNFYANGGTCTGSVYIDVSNPLGTFLNFMSAQMQPHMVFSPEVHWNFNGKLLEPKPKEFVLTPIGETIPEQAKQKPKMRLMPM